jgi:hypothetical protein
MGFREPLEPELAVAVGAVGGQVGAFIAAAVLGLITVRMVDLLVLPGLMHITVLLLVIGLMPSPTHCCGCVMGLHQHQALFHLPPNMLATMVGLDAGVADPGRRGITPAETVV